MLERLGQQSGVVMKACGNSTPRAAISARVRGMMNAPDGECVASVVSQRWSSVSENANDQFGSRVILLKASRLLCVPADVAAPAPGLPTSTTTTLPGDNTCRFS